MPAFPLSRLDAPHDIPPDPGGEWVLYWMIGQRRLTWNWALDRAADWARELKKPLLIVEAVGLDHPYASDRFHRVLLEGMRDHRRALKGTPVGYHAYAEPAKGAGQGLLATLAASAAVVVTDDLPHFIYPALLTSARKRVACRLEAVDSSGVIPVRHAERAFTTAYSFRRHLQKVLPEFLGERPSIDPLARPLPPFKGLPADLLARWPAIPADLGDSGPELSALPIDHNVAPVSTYRGGPVAAATRLEHFLEERLDRYLGRNVPDDDVGSGLSPALHWGHIASHQIVQAVLDREGWNPGRLSPVAKGAREGWWGLSAPAEAFLDQIVTWRELGFNGVRHIPDATSWESLPAWARDTLNDHADDPRPERYSLAQFERAETADPLWNAAQRQLREKGMIHNYLRMLWGKKILEWSDSPGAALKTLYHLNDKYALDGRDPNSVSGIMWTLGRYDRGWPERAIYGKIRSMSSPSTRRKVSVTSYLERFGPQASLR